MSKRVKGLGTILLMGVLLIFTSSCTMNRSTLLDVKGASDKVKKDEAYNKITLVLIDKGFDIKLGNKDLGLITTEYKQYASVASNPPFDFYLQIKTTLRDRPDGKLQVVMTPVAKDQNRLNAAAFTEHALIVYSAHDEQHPVGLKDSAYVKGHLLFKNVIMSVAELFGLGTEQLEWNLQQMEVSIL